MFPVQPSVVGTVAGYPNQTLIRLAAASPVSPGGGTIISTVSPGTLLTHFTLTSTVNFTTSSTPDITFTSSTAVTPLYATRVAEFIATVSTLLTVTPGTNAIVNGNPVLNPPVLPPTAYAVTGSGSYWIQIATLVKEGKTSKEIAELLNAKRRVIEFHRENIRAKLGLKNKKESLAVLLRSFSS